MHRERREKIVLRPKIVGWQAAALSSRRPRVGERDVVEALFGNDARGSFENPPRRFFPPFGMGPAPLRFAGAGTIHLI
jgi:hypothetical protein